jgi:Bacteriophage replication protein O
LVTVFLEGEISLKNYAEGSYHRGANFYLEAMKRVQSNRSDAIIIQEAFVRAEIMKRAFTKRQQAILLTIFSLSFPYGKTEALIPIQTDFSLSGIPRDKVRGELDKLIGLNVIQHRKEDGLNLYSIQDPRTWEAPYHHKYVNTRAIELFFLNMKHAGENMEDIQNQVLLQENTSKGNAKT